MKYPNHIESLLIDYLRYQRVEVEHIDFFVFNGEGQNIGFTVEVIPLTGVNYRVSLIDLLGFTYAQI